MIRSLTNPVATRNSTALVYNVLVSLAIFITLMLILGIWHIGNNPMIACGFFGAWFIHLGSRPSATHFKLSLLAGALCALIYVLMSGEIGVYKFHVFMGFCAFLGSGSIVVMSFDRVWSGSSKYDTPLRDAMILPVFSLIAGLSMQFTNAIPHKSFDYLLYRYDLSLGLTPGLTVYSWFQSHHWLDVLSVVTYDSLLCFPPLYHGWAMYKGHKPRIGLMQTFVIAGIIGFFLYQICPGIGPKVTFGGDNPYLFPAFSATPTNVFMHTSVANAMPSMHMTWALLVWVAAWELGVLALIVATLFVSLTALATLGISAHYMIDLLVSFPLIMAAKGIATARYRLTVIGLILCVGWEVYLRTGIEIPAAANWFLIAATLAITGILMRPLFTLNVAHK